MLNWLGNEEDDKWQMWLYGVVAPLPVAGVALLWIVSRHADLSDHRAKIVFRGMDAVVFGLVALCLALGLHFHFFWKLSPNPTLNRYYAVGEVLSMLGAMLGLLYTIGTLVRLFVL